MSNSDLFKQAHKMTKLTTQPNETYRYKFGQWLIFLKTGITNVLGFTKINQSVCYVPLLKHDREYHYKLSLPLTLTKTTKRANGNTKYIQYWHLDKYLFDMLKFVCTNPLSLFIIFMLMMFTLV